MGCPRQGHHLNLWGLIEHYNGSNPHTLRNGKTCFWPPLLQGMTWHLWHDVGYYRKQFDKISPPDVPKNYFSEFVLYRKYNLEPILKSVQARIDQNSCKNFRLFWPFHEDLHVDINKKKIPFDLFRPLPGKLERATLFPHSTTLLLSILPISFLSGFIVG